MTTLYKTGTLSVGAGSTSVTGTGTAWTTSGTRPGDLLIAGGAVAEIAAVNSATGITLANGWPAATQAAVNYAILQLDDGLRALIAANTLLQALDGGTLTSLAGLGGAANQLPYFTGEHVMALTGLTPWARSLLDDADVAGFWATIGASAGAAQAFRRGNVLGAVAQAGGVPTGALIERGSNGNGHYARFADGTQLCWHAIDDTTNSWATAEGALFRRASALGWTYAALFAAPPVVMATAHIGNDWVAGCRPRGLPDTAAVLLMPWASAAPGSSTGKTIFATALGRWF
ncbi:hypothetical protein [Pararhodobacter marinus]|uniref:hypothetical protein n=1 Tax=Pararhodobacter marinus TaxID=2184063 RepID=UPI0035143A44